MPSTCQMSAFLFWNTILRNLVSSLILRFDRVFSNQREFIGVLYPLYPSIFIWELFGLRVPPLKNLSTFLCDYSGVLARLGAKYFPSTTTLLNKNGVWPTQLKIFLKTPLYLLTGYPQAKIRENFENIRKIFTFAVKYLSLSAGDIFQGSATLYSYSNKNLRHFALTST